MRSDGYKNLIPMNQRTKDEQRLIATQGGEASGKARREKRDKEKEILTFELAAKGQLDKIQNPCLKNYAKWLDKLAKKEDKTPQEAKELREGLAFLRDSSGQKPVDKQEVNSTNVQKVFITQSDIEEAKQHINEVIND